MPLLIQSLIQNISIAAGMLPEYLGLGPRMSPSPNGDNVLLTMYYVKMYPETHTPIYTLTHSGSTYEWIITPQSLKIQRRNHVQFTVPAYMLPC